MSFEKSCCSLTPFLISVLTEIFKNRNLNHKLFYTQMDTFQTADVQIIVPKMLIASVNPTDQIKIRTKQHLGKLVNKSIIFHH